MNTALGFLFAVVIYVLLIRLPVELQRNNRIRGYRAYKYVRSAQSIGSYPFPFCPTIP